jgi:hypothetical protein
MESEQEEKKIVKRNLSECLTHHFNFPPSLLSAAMVNIYLFILRIYLNIFFYRMTCLIKTGLRDLL